MYVVSALTPRHFTMTQRVSLNYVWLVRLEPESNERDRNLLLPGFSYLCIDAGSKLEGPLLSS